MKTDRNLDLRKVAEKAKTCDYTFLGKHERENKKEWRELMELKSRYAGSDELYQAVEARIRLFQGVGRIRWEDGDRLVKLTKSKEIFKGM